MPHVVLTGNVNIDDIFNKLKGAFIRNESRLLKTENIYMSRDKTAILIESLAIEGGIKRSFFTMIGRRNDGVVVRIYQGSEVEKTVGVKSILGELAKQLLAAFPQLTIRETNLLEYLK
jgi:hypothetical protein